MELETVGRITVRDLRFQVRGQVDDVNRCEGAFFHADTASDAEVLRDKSDLGLWCHLDAQLARTNDRARLPTFLTAFLDSF